MRVCFVSHSSDRGGAERALIELIEALKIHGVECYVILPSSGELVDELRYRGITFDIIPYSLWMFKTSPTWVRARRGLAALANLLAVILIAGRIRRWRCEVVYTNTITVCVGAFAARLTGRTHIWHIHEFGYEDHGLIFYLGQKLSLWIVNQLSSLCIANSRTLAKKYERFIPSSKIKVVYYSMAFTARVTAGSATVPARNNADIRCVIVGILDEGKRQEDAIRAVSELARVGINAQLLIIGTANSRYANYLRDLATKYSIDKYVKFMGYVANTSPFIDSADVVLICSKSEAFGRVTVEAMLAGKPVIGARGGATTELIQDGFNGLLYDLGNHLELADKIRYLYEHPNVSALMGKTGRQWASERFSEDRYGEDVFAILKALTPSRDIANKL